MGSRDVDGLDDVTVYRHCRARVVVTLMTCEGALGTTTASAVCRLRCGGVLGNRPDVHPADKTAAGT